MKTNKRILRLMVVLAVFLLLSTAVVNAAWYGTLWRGITVGARTVGRYGGRFGRYVGRAGTWMSTTGTPWLKTTGSATDRWLSGGSNWWRLVGRTSIDLLSRIALVAVTWTLSRTIENDIKKNLMDYILTNPSPHGAMITNVMGFFASLLLPLYVLAILTTVFYILFVSSSPIERARAKEWLSRLVISMLFVSFSPYLLDILLGASGALSMAIMGTADVDIAAEEYVSTISGTRNMIFWANLPGMFLGVGGHVGGAGLGEALGRILRGGTWGKAIGSGVFEAMGAVDLEVGWFMFLVMLMLLLIFAIYFALVLRYFMVIMWIILFPLTIFFMSFRPTRFIGNIMFEQTLLWVFLQVFYAMVIVSIAIGLTILPLHNYEYGIGGTLGRTLGMLGTANISIYGLAATLMLFVGPITMLQLFRTILPPQ